MHVIVGLGNPDKKYATTRHNTGYRAIDVLARNNDIKLQKTAHKALIGEGYIGAKKVVLAKPITYMNLSGQSVVDLLNWYKADPASELIVLYDDIDLEVGALRVRSKGSAGTHNGLKSIIYLIGTDEFTRIRIGIGPCKPEWDLADFVLSGFDHDEKDPIEKALSDAADAVEIILRDGVTQAQAKYNKRAKKSKSLISEDEEAISDNANP